MRKPGVTTMLDHTCLEVLTTESSALWDEVLREVDYFDFYHLSAFHRLMEASGIGKAVMPVFRDKGCVIAFPLLVRDVTIPGVVDAGNGVKDAVSVPGFSGPVASTDAPPTAKAHFIEGLHAYLRQTGVVSVYARLHPVAYPPGLLDGYGEMVEIGASVSLDLSIPEDAQFAGYRKDHRKEIRRLQRQGFVCEKVGPEYLGDFMRLYYQTMDRVEAGPEFYFDKGYLEFLMREMPGVMHLFICRKDGDIASVEMCGVCNGMLEAYLSGTASEYVRDAPSKLLCDAIREWGNSIGARVFHLGGGVGAQRDSLFDFKMGFGGREHVYSTWRHVVDTDAYDELCRRVSQCSGIEPDDSYFPRYRHPALQQRVSSTRGEVENHGK